MEGVRSSFRPGRAPGRAACAAARVGVAGAALALLMGACSATSTTTTVAADGGVREAVPGDTSPAKRTPPTTIPLSELGDFDLIELESLGIVTTRIVEWVVIGDGRYVAFSQPGGTERGARVRVLDRSRAKVRTVDAELGAVSALLPAGGDSGVVYLSVAGAARSISYVGVDGEPVALVSVPAGTTLIDSVAVDPAQRHVVWRELRQGRVQVLVSSDLDGGSVVLDETMAGGMLGEGTESPIVLTEEGTVEYYADREGDGEPARYEVPIGGGEPEELADP